MATDSNGIADIKFLKDGIYFIVAQHNGTVAIYDSRTYQKVSEIIKAHETKFDDGALCLGIHSDLPFCASGGADSII